MAVLFANQLSPFNQEGKALFEVRRFGDKLLEGVRVIAVNEEDAKRIFLKQLAFIVRSGNKFNWRGVILAETPSGMSFTG